MSVQNVKEKLDAANHQIVSLLKDKIALNEKIAKLSKDKWAYSKTNIIFPYFNLIHTLVFKSILSKIDKN